MLAILGIPVAVMVLFVVSIVYWLVMKKKRGKQVFPQSFVRIEVVSFTYFLSLSLVKNMLARRLKSAFGFYLFLVDYLHSI